MLGFTVRAVAAAALAFSAGPAAAADWTGTYFGANIGYGWGAASPSQAAIPAFNVVVPLTPQVVPASNPFADTDADGVIGGLQFGWNWQAASWVFGLETDFQATGQKSTRTATDTFARGTGGGNAIIGSTTTTVETSLKWLGTLRGRAGYDFNNLLVYATGGLAYGRVDVSGASSMTGQLFTGAAACQPLGYCPFAGTFLFSDAETRLGWMLGVGIEGATGLGNSTWKIEYLYVDLGTSGGLIPYGGRFGDPTGTATVNASGGVIHNTRFTDNILRFGLNFKFGPRP